MPIQIGGQVDVNAPLPQVWEMIFDLDTMRRVINRVPGITLERLEQTDEMTYELTATVGVAAIKGKYDGKITVLDKTPPTHVHVKGEGKGGGNFTTGDVTLDLGEAAGHTVMVYKGIGNLNGPLAGLGQRLVDTVGRQFIDQGARIFANEIEQRAAPVAGEEAPMPEPEPYGFALKAFVAFVTVAAIIALLVALTLASVQRQP